MSLVPHKVFTDEQVIEVVVTLINNGNEQAKLGNITEMERRGAKAVLVGVLLLLGIPVVWDPSVESAAIATQDENGAITYDEPKVEPKNLELDGPAN